LAVDIFKSAVIACNPVQHHLKGENGNAQNWWIGWQLHKKHPNICLGILFQQCAIRNYPQVVSKLTFSWNHHHNHNQEQL